MAIIEPNRFSPETFKKLSEILEFKNKLQNSPLLFAVKRDEGPFFEKLATLGASLYTSCTKLMNALHYAVLNENTKMIEFICYADAESN